MKKKILMTGATGFVGRNFIQYNIEHNKYRIDACVRNGHIHDLPGVDNVKDWDIRANFELYFADDILGSGYDVFLHCASIVGNSPDISFFEYFNTNVLGTINTLKCAADLGIPNYIYISSGSVYGTPRGGVFTRESPCFPVGSYARTKYMGEQACAGVSQGSDGMTMSILRLFYPFGEGMQEFRSIPKILHDVKNKSPILIDYPNQLTINPIHINDICKYISCAIDSGGVGIQNISGKSVMTISEIAQIFANVIGVDPTFKLNQSKGVKGSENKYIGEGWEINMRCPSTETRLREYAESNK